MLTALAGALAAPLDAAMRRRVDAFMGRDPEKAWGWFVISARTVTPADFDRLVGRG